MWHNNFRTQEGIVRRLEYVPSPVWRLKPGRKLKLAGDPDEVMIQQIL